MAEYYVLSQRQLRQDPAIGCLIEFEDVLVKACSATLITPGWSKPTFRRLLLVSGCACDFQLLKPLKFRWSRFEI